MSQSTDQVWLRISLKITSLKKFNRAVNVSKYTYVYVCFDMLCVSSDFSPSCHAQTMIYALLNEQNVYSPGSNIAGVLFNSSKHSIPRCFNNSARGSSVVIIVDAIWFVSFADRNKVRVGDLVQCISCRRLRWRLVYCDSNRGRCTVLIILLYVMYLAEWMERQGENTILDPIWPFAEATMW